MNDESFLSDVDLSGAGSSGIDLSGVGSKFVSESVFGTGFEFCFGSEIVSVFDEITSSARD